MPSSVDNPKILSYVEYGSGPALLLLHGWGISFAIWSQLIPHLQQPFRLIVPEMPGIGASPLPQPGNYYDVSARAVEDLRTHLAIDRWSIVGYSLGGWVARSFARRWPERVDRLMFLCWARPYPAASVTMALLLEIDRRFPRWGNWLLTRWRLAVLVAALGFNGQPTPLAALWVSEISLQSIPIVKQTLRHMPAWGQAGHRLPPVPTRFVWGKHDILGVAPFFPGEHDRIVRGTHGLPMTNPEGVAKEVFDFFGRTTT